VVVRNKPKVKGNARPTLIYYTTELEQRLAAIACHYTFEQYRNLPGDEDWVGRHNVNSKAMVIATYRAKRQIEQETK